VPFGQVKVVICRIRFDTNGGFLEEPIRDFNKNECARFSRKGKCEVLKTMTDDYKKFLNELIT